MRRSLILLTAMILLSSCKMVSSLLHDDDVVARVGENKLYRAELSAHVPADLSGEDSTRVALQYINTWASDIVFLGAAQKELSKNEKDVSAQLEEYRRALLKYRYEQLYINQRLDTAVSDTQIREYYQKHMDSYKLSFPVVKARFLRISSDSPDYETLKRLMSSSDDEDHILLDSLAYKSADRYTDYSEKWVDITVLSREFGEDYGTLLSSKSGSFIENELAGKINLAYICDILRTGAIPPVEYCSDKIRDALVSARKQKLVSDLEQDLLRQARVKGNYEIYE